MSGCFRNIKFKLDLVLFNYQSWKFDLTLFNESAKLRTLLAHVPTCLACLRAHVPTCLACLRAHVPTCLACLRGHVLTCLACLLAHMPTFLASWHASTFLARRVRNLADSFLTQCSISIPPKSVINPLDF